MSKNWRMELRRLVEDESTVKEKGGGSNCE